MSFSPENNKSSKAANENISGANKKIGIGRVITIIVLIALAIIWSVSLWTYDSTDPSLHSSNSEGIIHNAIGCVGSYSADALLQTFGCLSVFVPILILSLCGVLLRSVKIKKLIAPTISIILFLFSLGCLITLSQGNSFERLYPIGGFAAKVGVYLIYRIMGRLGTIIIMALLLAISIVVGFAEYTEKYAVLAYSWFVVSFRNLSQKISQKINTNKFNEIDREITNSEKDDKDILLIAGSNKNEPVTAKQNSDNNIQEMIEGEWELGTIGNNEEKCVEVIVPPNTRETEDYDISPALPENVGEFSSQSEENYILPKVSVCPDTNEDNSDNLSKKEDDSNLITTKSTVLETAYNTSFEEDETPFAFEDDESGAVNDLPKIISNAKEPEVPEMSITTADNGATENEIKKASIEQNKLNAIEKRELGSRYSLPSPDFLNFKEAEKIDVDEPGLNIKREKLIKTLESFGIKGRITNSLVGPVVTVFEFVPDAGIKVSKISSLADDIAMSMQAMQVRIVAPIPGKGAVGIEIPSEHRQVVYLREIVASRQFREAKSKLTLCLGKDVEGEPYVADLAKMPHLLIAGATGTGKSVGINAMLTSILYKATADDVRLIMVDPKQLELSIYEGIPHLLLPVVCDPKKASLALHWAVEEMERRYGMMAELGVRNLAGYNEKIKELSPEDLISKEGQEFVHLPYIVILIDEFADLMMVASKEIETFVARLAQKARAAGIHLILATQRPSVDVITGTIKANFPSRISFQVSSGHDAKTILDTVGSEHLLGMGDMLFMSAGGFGLTRVHGALVTEKEIDKVVSFLKAQGEPQYDESILAAAENSGDGDNGDNDGMVERGQDELYDKAIAFVAKNRKVSISLLQRYLGIGYNRSANIVERMERDGIVGPANGSKPREVLIPESQDEF